MRVLVVDDNSLHLLILRKIFERGNDSVVVAHIGVEALEVLEKDNGFNIILTDIMMPFMDGVELLVNLKKVIKPIKSRLSVLLQEMLNITGKRRQYRSIL